MTYFYIITFDGQIFEIRYTEEKINSAVRAWQEGAILLLGELGGGIHGNSISKVLNEENYDSYTHSVKPKLFIKNGTWYDGRERGIIRYEKWKQDEIDNKLKLFEARETKEELLPPGKINELLEKYKPDFLTKTKELSEKMKM